MTSPVSIPAGHALVGADFDAYENLTGPWTSYVATWTASSSNPAIGNGTIDGHYIQAGDLLIYKGVIVVGSTTTFGTGYWIITIPVAVTLGQRNVGVAALHDSSTSTNDRAGALELLSSTTFRVVANGRVDATTPFTWASGDVLQWFYVGECA